RPITLRIVTGSRSHEQEYPGEGNARGAPLHCARFHVVGGSLWNIVNKMATRQRGANASSSGLDTDVHVRVHVRSTAEVPDEARAFDAPDIPHLVVADVAILIERQVQLIHAAGFFENGEDLIHVFLAIRGEQR